ncbi:MAG: NAD(+) diphosphatase [Blastomonas sp.]
MATIWPAFSGATIDRSDQVRVDPDQLAGLMNFKARVLRLTDLVPEIGPDARLQWRSLAECGQDSDFIFLGLLDGKAHFVELPRGERGGAIGFNPRLWQGLTVLPAEELALYGAARSLVDWHVRHGFCARCGATTVMVKGGWSRNCESCKAEHFPRVDPVTIMLAEHDGRVLLGRQPQFPPRRLSALAGFVEPGENIEEAVQRELWEEAGIRVRNVRYVASQPWPFPSSLMIACTSEAEDDRLTLDTTEIEEAAWFTADEVRAAFAGEPDAPFIAPPPFAIAHDLLRWWLDQQD